MQASRWLAHFVFLSLKIYFSFAWGQTSDPKPERGPSWYDDLEWWVWVLIVVGGLFGLIILCILWEILWQGIWSKVCGCDDKPGELQENGNEVTEITVTSINSEKMAT